jgi:hypothetical protein
LRPLGKSQVSLQSAMADRLEQLKKELPPGRFRSFEEIEKSIFHFERVLRSFGINIESGSRLEAACLSGIHMLMAKTGTARVSPCADIRPSLIDVCGLWQFVERVNRLEGTPFLQELVPHLHLLMEGDFAQNRKSDRHDAASNKLFELLVGLSAADIGADTELDHPDASTGHNPDVLTTIQTGGPAFRIPERKRWAFACKTLHSDAPKTLYDRVEEGIDQIRRAPSAETGVVVVNLKNIIDHDSLFPVLNRAEYHARAEPIFGAYRNIEDAAALLRERSAALVNAMVQTIGENEVDDTFRRAKAVPAIVLVAQSTAGTATKAGPIPSLLTVMHLHRLIGVRRPSPHEQAIMERLNHSLQDRLVS